jgi:hypothetical protein
VERSWPATPRDRVGEQEHVDQATTVLLERGGGRWSVVGRTAREHETLAAREQQPAQCGDGGIAPTVFVGRDDRLRGTGAPGQLGLRETVPSTNRPDELARLHESEYIESSMSGGHQPDRLT